ncbi:MAG: cytochrome c oxidase assembly protein [Deltaproteobacteria bacterium]|nr:cytochrome c oxidase assembly protein [Deltaproteobacteria bacterium]
MWQADSSTLIALFILAGLYVGASLRLRRQPTAREGAAFVAALLAILIAITGPLDELTRERSFAAYIFQQMLPVFVVPPLLLFGLPGWMLRPLMLNRFVEPVARVITRPLFAFLLFAAVFTLIHYPIVCDRVCHVHPFYGNLHALLLFVGSLLWWPLLSPLPEYPRMTYPMQIMYLFLLMIPMTAVAAPITMANSVLYVFYMDGMHPLGLTPIADQVLGGLIMWVGQGVYIMFVFTAIFFRWSRWDDQEEPPLNRGPIQLKPVSVQRQ